MVADLDIWMGVRCESVQGKKRSEKKDEGKANVGMVQRQTSHHIIRSTKKWELHSKGGEIGNTGEARVEWGGDPDV